jgi:hypothetical protein
MAQIVHRASEHGTRNLQKNKTRTWIDVGVCRTLKCNHERSNLQNSKQPKP